MTAVYCYSFVEDAPSAAVAIKLVEARNKLAATPIIFRDGYPLVTGGYGAIKVKCRAFLSMARSGIYSITLTDLDEMECACSLIRDWFNIPAVDEVALPKECVFRVIVREIESWILADTAAWAEYIGIPASNFSQDPDNLNNPKQHLLNVVRKKGKKKVHREMLPKGTAHIGPLYNEVICDFVSTSWSPQRASTNSSSLDRAMKALLRI